MFRFNHDFSSRFRILKGGKVSLVVSAMLLGAISADAGTLTNASIVPDSNVVGAKTNYTFNFTTESEVTADNYVLYAWLPSNFTFSHTSGTSDNNNFAIPCSDVVESITVDGFPATCDAARSWSSPAPTAVQISLDSAVPAGSVVVVKLKNINNFTTAGSSDFIMLGTSLPGGVLDEYPSKTVSLVDGTVFSATVNTTSQVLDINSTHGEPGAWDDYINLNNNSSCSIATGKHYYQTQTFIATQDANHTIDTASLNGFFNEDLAIGDNFMAVYQGVFDPSNPTANLVGCNDDIDYDNNNLFARFSTDLTTGQAYTMVFTSSMSPEYVDTYFAYSNPEGAITGNGTFAVSPAVSLAYSLSGSVSGLENGETLTLSGVGTTDKVISANGSFIFDTPLANSANYNITARLSNASNQFRTCTVSNGTGAINSANVNNISVSCTEDVNYAPVFGVGTGKGIISTLDNQNDMYYDAKYQASSGQYVVLTQNGLIRFNADGTKDSTFGTGGKVAKSTYTTDSSAISFEIDSQGRILLAEDMNLAQNAWKANFQVRRLNADGTLDTSFGASGVFSTDVRSDFTDIAKTIKSLSDGSMIVLGLSQGGTNGSGTRYEATAIKVTEAGVLDTSFGTSGKLFISSTSGENEDFTKVISDANGNIYGMGRVGNTKIILTKFSSAGVLDATFGTGGVLYIDADPTADATYVSEIGHSLALQSDGKIVIAAMLGQQVNSTVAKAGVIRVNANGTLDNTFGTNGVVALDKFTDQGEIGRGVAVNSDGTILLASSTDYNINLNKTGNFYVAKLTSTGALDTTFGTDGIHSDAFTIPDNFYATGGVMAQLYVGSDGDIFGIGSSVEAVGTPYGAPVVMRLDKNGNPDINFGVVPKVGSTVKFSEGGSPIVLESSAYLYDRDLYSTNYNGVVVSLARQGGANTNDIFGATGNLTLENGDVNLSTTKIGTFTNTDGNLTITFNSDANQTAVSTALSSLTYENNATILPSSVVIDWRVTDNNSGTQGSGGVLIGEGNTTVNIQKVPKLSGGNSAVATEETDYTFSINDFGTYLPMGNETVFQEIKIISLPTNGVLKNNGNEMNINSTIDSWSIDNDRLVFVPNKDVYGDGIDGFSFQVGAYDSNYNVIYGPTYTMELNVSGVNDTPSFKISDGVDSIVLNNHYLDSDSDNVMALQSDGKMVVAGNDGDYFQVVRLNGDGTLDSTFGNGGKVILSDSTGDGYAGYLKTIKLDANGNIFVAGESNNVVVVSKLNSSGVKQFATEVNFSLYYNYIQDLALDGSEKIVVVGSTYDDDSETNIAIARLNADGTLDTSFGTSGKVEINSVSSGTDRANAVAMQGDKILVGGTKYENGAYNSVLYRLNSDGSIDNNFNYSSIADKLVYFLSYDEATGIVAGGRDNSTGSYVEIVNATNGTQTSLTSLGVGRYFKDMVSHNGTAYYSIYDSSNYRSTIVAVGTNNFTKTFTTGEQEESYSGSIELASDGSLFAGSLAYDVDWNSIYTITKLDGVTGEIKTIGGESSLGQTITHNRATPIVLDSDVTLKDNELDVTNYNGATVTLAREGGANPNDILSFTDVITVSGNTLSLGNTYVGTFSQTDGNMTINFGDVNTSIVNTTLRNITYQNTESGDENITIAWNFSDGNGATDGGQGSGGAKIAVGNTQIAITGTYVPPTTNSVSLSVPYKTGMTEVTIISPTGTNITGATNNPSNKVPQKGVTLPLGSFAFDINGLTTGQTVTMSMIVDRAIGSYAYYKKNNLTNKWVNITKSVTFLDGADAGKVKIDFDLKDGGAFDTDGVANGTIKDPGGIASNTLTPYVVEGTTLVGDASFVDDSNSNNFSGTIVYSISGGADADKFTINSTTGTLSFKTAPSFTNPTDLGDIAGNNTYAVEVSVAGSTSGRESRAITVSVLSATGSNTPKAIAPAISSDNITIGKGSADGSTKITYSPVSGNSIKYIFSEVAMPIPSYDASLPNEATTYTSGANITGAQADKYLTIYELDSTGNIVGYYQQMITEEEIYVTPTVPEEPTTPEEPNEDPITITSAILDQVLDINYVSHFTLDLRNFIENATAYSFERVQSSETINWLTINPQTGEFSASGTVPTGTYYIKVTATKGSASKVVYFTLRAKDLTANLATNITKPTGATNTIGSESGKAYAETTLNITDAKVFDDGSASHKITGISEATSELPDSTVVINDAGDVTTSTTTINETGNVVDIKVEGKVSGDDKAIHTLKVGNKETVAKSKITGTTTTIKEDRTVETKATVSGNEAKATALPDGTATHIIKVGLVESKATIEIAGAQTVIDTTGITTSVDENQTIGGNAIMVKSIVKTDTQGESQTWFEDNNGVQLERTVSSNTPLESGATVNVSKDTNGKLQFKIKTKVTRDLTIE